MKNIAHQQNVYSRDLKHELWLLIFLIINKQDIKHSATIGFNGI